MYLAQLKLTGFKSFFQETTISLEPGITAIVGPNGCGKSNICDAIRWVLGEQGHRPLRADRMEDIIFNGNGSHQPLGMAEVSLTIAAHADQLPIAFSEITIGRRLFRSGESEYLLNGSPCLLRDILNLFLDSGLGNLPYALIEQGALASLIEAKPVERKAMIEEAAGVMKYKVRRKAAMAKLEAAEQNLLRLQDIIKEVEQQRNSLYRQAKKAKEYEQSRTRIEYLDGYLRLHQYREARRETDGLAIEVREEMEAKRSLLARIRNQEEELERERGALHALGEILQERQQSLFRIRGEKDRAAVQAEMLRSEGEELAEAERRVGGDLLSSSAAIDQLQRELGAGSEEEGTLKEGLDSLRKRWQGLQEREDGLSQELARQQDSLEGKRREAIQAAALSSSHRNQWRSLEGQARRLAQQREKLEGQRAALSSEISEMQTTAEELRKRLDDLTRAQGERDAKREEIARALASALQEEQETDRSLNALQRQLDELAGQLRSYEGRPEGRSRYGKDAGAAPGEDEPPSRRVEGVLGCLSDLFEVKPGYERAIDALLDVDLEGLVLEDWNAIWQALHPIDDRRRDGAIFLPCSLSTPGGEEESRTAAEEPDLHPVGPVERAMDLIQCEARYSPLMRRLLSQCWVAPDLEVAWAAFAEGRGGLTIATPQGEVITAQGAVRLPCPSARGLLTWKREMRDLGDRMERVRAEHAALQGAREALEGRLSGLQAELDSLESEAQALQIERVTLEKEQAQLEMVWGRLEQQRELLAIEMGTLEGDIQEVDSESRFLQKQEEASSAEQLVCEEEIRRLQGSLEVLRKQREHAREEREACEGAIRAQEEENRQKEVQRARREEQHRSLEERRGQLDRELTSLRERTLQVRSSLEEKEGFLSRLSAQETQIQGSLQTLNQEKEEKSQQLGEKEEGLDRSRHQLAEIEGLLGDLQIKKAQLDSDLHHLVQGLTPSAASGLSQVEARYEGESLEVTAAREEWNREKERCQRLEPVNMAALTDYEALSKRYAFLMGQAEDLRLSASSLRQSIAEINKTTQRLFREAFAAIEQSFIEYCTYLFGGGSAGIRLQGSQEKTEEEAGIEITVFPPGKHLTHLDLLSGGEKSLAALAFLLALFKYRPAPFCLLDEVDAALDDANVGRYLSLLGKFSQEGQFILVTHNKRTMEAAGSLYGVTMEEPGISKIVSVKLEGNGEGRERTKAVPGGRNGD